MYKVIALMGEAGSGKDFILREVLKACPNFHKIINCTTRPKRENEMEGVNYFYLSNEEFANKIIDMTMIEAAEFNNWFYGTSIEALQEKTINIGVFNPTGLEILLDRSDIQLIIYRIKTSDKERLLRQLNREENPDVKEIIRRFNTDSADFSIIDFSYIEIENNTIEDLRRAVQQIAETSFENA